MTQTRLPVRNSSKRNVVVVVVVMQKEELQHVKNINTDQPDNTYTAFTRFYLSLVL